MYSSSPSGRFGRQRQHRQLGTGGVPAIQGGRCGAGVAPDGELVQQRARASRDLCAALLEIATRLGGSPPLTNAVRFGFWGSEEVDLNGSTEYVTACPTRNAGT